MKKTALTLSAAVLLASGCAMTTQKTDPFAGLGVSADAARPALYPGVSLAVVLSENTKRSAKVARDVEARSLGRVPAGAVFKDAFDFLGRNFKGVNRAQTLEEAAASGADAIVVLDMSMHLPATAFGRESLETSLLFMDSAKNLLAVAKSSSSASVRETPFSPLASVRSSQAFMIASRRNYEALYASLREVKFLADLQAKRGMPAPAAPAVAAAPAAPAAPPAKTYRSEVEAPSFNLPEDGSKFALVIGVENYQNAPAADHAARDARAVKAHLRGLGYPERNIVLLTDQQAGKSSLEKYLDAWLPKNTDEKSTVAFYFSGHGAPNPEDGQAYLMPWDGDPKFLENTGYPVKRLYERLNALKAKKVLVAMDACFSGAGGRSVIAKGTRPLVGKVDEGRSVAGRVAALTASAADETTGAAEEAGHGLFTYHLLRSLNAKGGRATFKQLYDDLTPKVRDAARRDNRDQTPQLIGDGGASL